MTKINTNHFNKFEKMIITAAYLSLEQKENPIRFNNFCYAVREAFTLFFNRNGPSEQIKLCRWYKKPTKIALQNGAREVNLRDKIHFSLHGGIAPKHTSFRKLNVEREISKLFKKYQKLNSFTHINEERYNLSATESERQLLKITQSWNSFFTKYNKLRNNIIRIVQKKILQEIEDNLSAHYIYKLCIFGVRGTEAPEIEQIKINQIDHDTIKIVIEGCCRTYQRLGGKRDGIDHYTTFPFYLPAEQNVGFRKPPSVNWEKIEIDESPWTD